MQPKKRYRLVLPAVFLIVYIAPLGIRDLLVPDETRYAEIPREMIASGDWVVPRLDGVRYFEKPVLGYWVHAGSILLLGENAFAVRLPSALSVGLSALLVYLLVSRANGREGGEGSATAVLAALIYLTCFEVIGVGTTAVLDSLLAFFLTATVVSFFFASEQRPGSAAEKWLLAAAGFSCGLAFLTKGFLAFAVPVLTLVPYLVWQRRTRDLFRMAWLPLGVAVLVSAPWSILIFSREPDFWPFFFWHEHVHRFFSARAQHDKPIWYFFLFAPLMFMPWAFVAPAAVKGIRERTGSRDAVGRVLRLSLCWFVLTFLFFSISRGKLLTYILPCFPPFAVLMSLGLSRVLEKGRSRAFRWGVLATGILFGLILVVLVYVQWFGYKGFHPYSNPWKMIPVTGGLVVFITLVFLAYKTGTARSRILLIGLAPVLFFLIAPGALPESVVEANCTGSLLKRHRGDITPDTVIISDRASVGPACWYFRRSDVYVLGNTGELGYGLGYEDAAGRVLDVESAADLIRRNPGNAVFVVRARRLPEWLDRLPKPVLRDDNGADGYILLEF